MTDRMTFIKYEGAKVILRSKGGVYSPANVFTCNGLFYAAKGRGFLQLRYDGKTSDDKTWCAAMSFDKEPFLAGTGKIYLAEEGHPDAVPMSDEPKLREVFLRYLVAN